MRVISTERLPIKLWLPYGELEDGAMFQIRNLANLPFAFHHIAIMPDSHQGYGMPIGGVMATKNVIVPNAVGVDIGCGMCAVQTSLTEITTEQLKLVLGEIRKQVPVGFKHHSKKLPDYLMPRSVGLPESGIVAQEYENAREQIGTLGGGNHFIEIQKGSDGHIWIMIHSGSRNIGLKIAEKYDAIARELNERYHSTVDKTQDLAFLPLEEQAAVDYIKEMNYAVEFALANRSLMMETIKSIFVYQLGRMEFEPMINIAHNYAQIENHFGQNVWVHRKGATLAREGTVGIIPGSMGTHSYIVMGKGNPDSFTSCSHGAGRRLGRNQAIKTLNLEKEIKAMDEKGIIHGIRSTKQLDEAPSAYKNIDEVMSHQSDLIDISVTLQPLAVVKG